MYRLADFGEAGTSVCHPGSFPGAQLAHQGDFFACAHPPVPAFARAGSVTLWETHYMAIFTVRDLLVSPDVKDAYLAPGHVLH